MIAGVIIGAGRGGRGGEGWKDVAGGMARGGGGALAARAQAMMSQEVRERSQDTLHG